MPEMHRQQAGPSLHLCLQFTVFLSCCAMLALTGCGKRPTSALAATKSESTPTEASRSLRHIVRLTGTVQAVQSFIIQTPSIRGQGGSLTLIKLVPNGATVDKGEVIAEFDPTAQLQNERDTEARVDDLRHQIEQKIAEQHSNAENRASQLQQAQADLEKARLEIKKGPILSSIDEQKNAAMLEDAMEHVASLKRSNHFHDLAEAAELRVLQLQEQRQEVALERTRDNMQKLIVHAPLSGMVSLDNIWRNGSMGHAQEGDQLWPRNPLLRIFDPSRMEVRLTLSEPDDAVLHAGLEGIAHIDAYPDLPFRAVFDSASPVATSALESPVKTFDARFRLLSHDAHLLPDLSAYVEVEAGGVR